MQALLLLLLFMHLKGCREAADVDATAVLRVLLPLAFGPACAATVVQRPGTKRLC
jgi:hypothetical protein